MSKKKSARISPASPKLLKPDLPKTLNPIDPLWAEVAAVVTPPPFVSALEWCQKHLRIPEETESPGAFDLSIMPHVRDVLIAANHHDVRRILLRWAARNSKTYTSIALLIYRLCTDYLPLLFAGPDKDKTRDTVRDVLWPMLKACVVTRDLLPPENKRSDGRVIVGKRKVRIANAGSKSALSGYPAAGGTATELSKWPRKKSNEAAAIERFNKRFKLFPYDSLQILEGTPAIKGECEITREVEKPSTRRHYRHVPCPHCGEFQRLQFSPEYGEHPSAGIKYDKAADGRETARLAETTAWYQCISGCRIDDAHRHKMMNAGVWLAEGLSIDKHGKITGEALIESDDWAFDELSSLYSLLIAGWGQIAAEFVKAREKNDPEAIRSFVNETLARCYDPAPPATKFHEIAERLRSTVPIRTVPSWARFLVWVSDVGSMYSLPLYWWTVFAFGPLKRCAAIDYDLAKGDEELHKALARFQFSQENSKRSCRPVIGGIDCGYRIKSHSGNAGAITHHLYQLCDDLTTANESMPCVALHGSAASNFPDVYRWGYRQSGVRPREAALNRKMQRGDLLEVNTHITQTWFDASVRGLTHPNDPGAITLPAELTDPDKHPDCIPFLNQLAAEHYDGTGWQSTGPHEWRDNFRYALALAELYVNQQHAKWENPPGFADSIAAAEDVDTERGSPWIQPRRSFDFTRRQR
jgi:hypothetical protein